MGRGDIDWPRGALSWPALPQTRWQRPERPTAPRLRARTRHAVLWGQDCDSRCRPGGQDFDTLRTTCRMALGGPCTWHPKLKNWTARDPIADGPHMDSTNRPDRKHGVTHAGKHGSKPRDVARGATKTSQTPGCSGVWRQVCRM